MEASRLDSSRMDSILRDQALGLLQDQIIHSHCSCYHCVNGTTPILPPTLPRETSPSQTDLNPAEALSFILRKACGYMGIFMVPDIYFFQEGQLYYCSDSGKLRIREKLTNQEAKKFLEDRRKRYMSRAHSKLGLSLQMNSSHLTVGTERESRDKGTSYSLLYRNGTTTLMTQSHFNKVIFKRKTDPFWQDVLAVLVMPVPRQSPLEYKQFRYVRDAESAEQMQTIMEKVARDVDAFEEASDKEEHNRLSNASMMLQYSQPSDFLPTQTFGPELSNSLVLPLHKIQTESKMRLFPSSPQKVYEELIAFIQIVAKHRILHLELQYLEDFEGLPFLMGIKKLIVAELSPEQLTLTHDRYKPLEHIGIKELAEQKKALDRQDEESLWGVCIAILESCLQQRRIFLRIKDYRKPSKAELRLMYSKFFPEFSPEKMFGSPNWKNQLPKFMEGSKRHIEKMICEDDGISILKRFGVNFYRTFTK